VTLATTITEAILTSRPGVVETLAIPGAATLPSGASRDQKPPFMLLEIVLEPGRLAAPLHTHRDVDEAMIVVAGRVGARIGEDVVIAGPGDVVLKPRGVPHTFWNAGDTPSHQFEVIAPGTLDGYFVALDELVNRDEVDLDAIVALADRYGIELELASVAELERAHGVRLLD
jgi:mannose-6-phosphate isomerase-like protein (cupin superfamily)